MALIMTFKIVVLINQFAFVWLFETYLTFHFYKSLHIDFPKSISFTKGIGLNPRFPDYKIYAEKKSLKLLKSMQNKEPNSCNCQEQYRDDRLAFYMAIFHSVLSC